MESSVVHKIYLITSSTCFAPFCICLYSVKVHADEDGQEKSTRVATGSEFDLHAAKHSPKSAPFDERYNMPEKMSAERKFKESF